MPHQKRTCLKRGQCLRRPVDIKEEGNAYVFVIDMPGVKSGDIKVRAEDENGLLVAGETKRNGRRRRLGKFMRKFQLPESANVDKISAVCKDGILSVTVEKLGYAEEAKDH